MSAPTFFSDKALSSSHNTKRDSPLWVPTRSRKICHCEIPAPSFNGLPWQHACRWGISSGCHGNALPSVMKPVANLDKNFAGIQKVRSAEGEAVIQ